MLMKLAGHEAEARKSDTEAENFFRGRGHMHEADAEARHVREHSVHEHEN